MSLVVSFESFIHFEVRILKLSVGIIQFALYISLCSDVLLIIAILELLGRLLFLSLVLMSATLLLIGTYLNSLLHHID